MTPIESLLEAADKTTPGPWDACTAEDYLDGPVVLGDSMGIRVGKVYIQDDCNFIAAARNAIPEIRLLMERLKAAEEVIDNLKVPSIAAENYRQRFPKSPQEGDEK